MSNRHTQLRHQSRDGDRFQVTAHETDSSILPLRQLRELQEFRPDLVDWVVRQTEDEADARRARQRRVDTFVFVERVSGIFLGALIAALGLGISAYLGMHGAQKVATTLGGGTLVAIVALIIRGTSKRQDATETAERQSKE